MIIYSSQDNNCNSQANKYSTHDINMFFDLFTFQQQKQQKHDNKKLRRKTICVLFYFKFQFFFISFE